MSDKAKAPRRPTGGVSLGTGQFRGAVSTYDKRAVIEKRRALQAKKFKKYKSVLKRLEAEGRLADVPPMAAADLEAVVEGQDAGGGVAAGGSDSGRGGDSGGDSGGTAAAKRRQQVGSVAKHSLPRSTRAKHEQQPAARDALPPPPLDNHGHNHQQQQQQQQHHHHHHHHHHQKQHQPRPQQHTSHGQLEKSLVGGGSRGLNSKPKAPSQLERLAAKRQEALEQARAEQEQRAQEDQRRREQQLQREVGHTQATGELSSSLASLCSDGTHVFHREGCVAQA